jgi:hypothetical protein
MEARYVSYRWKHAPYSADRRECGALQHVADLYCGAAFIGSAYFLGIYGILLELHII